MRRAFLPTVLDEIVVDAQALETPVWAFNTDLIVPGVFDEENQEIRDVVFDVPLDEVIVNDEGDDDV
jgi:hypothetical protein